MAIRIELKAEGWNELPSDLRGLPRLLLFELGRTGRTHEGLTYGDLADLIGSSRNTISGRKTGPPGVLERLRSRRCIETDGFDDGKKASGRLDIIVWELLFIERGARTAIQPGSDRGGYGSSSKWSSTDNRIGRAVRAERDE